jgi:hypothetical protein
VSAATAGNTAAAGRAADSAAVEQIPFIRVLLEKSVLIGNPPFEWVLNRTLDQFGVQLEGNQTTQPLYILNSRMEQTLM